jgi:hypothetical protein
MSHQLRAINYSDDRLYVLPEEFANIFCDINQCHEKRDLIMEYWNDGWPFQFKKQQLQKVVNTIKRMSQKSCIEKYDLYYKNKFCKNLQNLIDFSDLKDWVTLTF